MFIYIHYLKACFFYFYKYFHVQKNTTVSNIKLTSHCKFIHQATKSKQSSAFYYAMY